MVPVAVQYSMYVNNAHGIKLVWDINGERNIMVLKLEWDTQFSEDCTTLWTLVS